MQETAYADVHTILPKLAQPGWIKWIGVPVIPLIVVPPVDPIRHKKALRNASRRHTRLLRALRGVRVRNRTAPALPS